MVLGCNDDLASGDAVDAPEAEAGGLGGSRLSKYYLLHVRIDSKRKEKHNLRTQTCSLKASSKKYRGYR